MQGLNTDTVATGAKYRTDNNMAPSLRRRMTNEGEDENLPPNAYYLIGSSLENSGAHGIPNIVRAHNYQRRVVWAILFLTGVAMFIWQSETLISTYFEFGVTVNVDILYANRINYPAITICNMNPYHRARLSNFSSELDSLLGLSNTNGNTALPPAQMTTASTTTQASQRYQDWNNIDYGQVDERASLLEQSIAIVGSAPYEERSTTGHELDDMLLSCHFENLPCSPSNFTHFYNYMYGNCYTYNSGASEELLRVSKIGPLYGLTLELYIQQEEYIASLQPAAGMRLVIHDQREMPFPEDQGVVLAPGRETSVGISLVEISRLSHPYTNCSGASAIKAQNVFKEKFPHIDYSRSACEKDCFFDRVVQDCNCSDARYRYNNTITPCNSSNDQCVDDVEMRYSLGNLACGCTMPCSQNMYELTVSEALWPNEGYKPTVIAGIEAISDDLKRKLATDPDFIESNVVKANIYFENLQYEYIYQTPAYDRFSLVSDLGGQIGLWIGVSVLTIFEFVELVYDLFKLCFMKITDSEQKRRKKNEVMSLDVKKEGTTRDSVFT